MVSSIQIIGTIVSIIIVEYVLLWFIYQISRHDLRLLSKETEESYRYIDRIRIWVSQRVRTNRHRMIFYAFLYSLIAVSFWIILLFSLGIESFEVLFLTSWLLPTCIIWGCIDGYSRPKTSQDDLTEDTLRPTILNLYRESISGNQKAIEELTKLRHRNDKIGILTREILQTLE